MGIDEYEVSMEILNIKKAIQLGIFLRENRMEMAGSGNQEAKPAVKKPAARKSAEPVVNPLLSEPAVSAPAPVVSNNIIAPPAAPKAEPVAPEKKETEINGESVALSFDLN